MFKFDFKPKLIGRDLLIIIILINLVNLIFTFQNFMILLLFLLIGFTIIGCLCNKRNRWKHSIYVVLMFGLILSILYNFFPLGEPVFLIVTMFVIILSMVLGVLASFIIYPPVNKKWMKYRVTALFNFCLLVYIFFLGSNNFQLDISIITLIRPLIFGSGIISLIVILEIAQKMIFNKKDLKIIRYNLKKIFGILDNKFILEDHKDREIIKKLNIIIKDIHLINNEKIIFFYTEVLENLNKKINENKESNFIYLFKQRKKNIIKTIERIKKSVDPKEIQYFNKILLISILSDRKVFV